MPLPHIDVPVTELIDAAALLAPPPSPEPAMEKNLTEQIEKIATSEWSKMTDDDPGYSILEVEKKKC